MTIPHLLFLTGMVVGVLMFAIDLTLTADMKRSAIMFPFLLLFGAAVAKYLGLIYLPYFHAPHLFFF